MNQSQLSNYLSSARMPAYVLSCKTQLHLHHPPSHNLLSHVYLLMRSTTSSSTLSNNTRQIIDLPLGSSESPQLKIGTKSASLISHPERTPTRRICPGMKMDATHPLLRQLPSPLILTIPQQLRNTSLVWCQSNPKNIHISTSSPPNHITTTTKINQCPE